MSTWPLEERARARRAAETILFPKKHAGDIRVCLVYPNRYAVAMGNLGFQAVYEIFDRHAGRRLRARLPARRGGRAADRARRAAQPRVVDRRSRDFDVIAFSISFETDYWHVVRLLDLIGLPLTTRERGGHGPLVIAGGPAVFLNPEPLADFIDLFLIGEAEEMLPEFLDRAIVRAAVGDRVDASLGAVATAGRRRLRPGVLRAAATTGRCSPACAYQRPRRAARRAPADLGSQHVPDDDARAQRRGGVRRHDAGRGQPRLPVGLPLLRRRLHVPADPHARRRAARRSRCAPAWSTAQTIGLVGAEMASVPGVDRARRRSPPRRRPAVAVVAQGRLRHAAAGRRAGARPHAQRHHRAGGRLRTHAAGDQQEPHRGRHPARRRSAGRRRRPGSEALLHDRPADRRQRRTCWRSPSWPAKIRDRLAGAERARRRVANITVSVNPFVPKPWTPFQWDPMEAIPGLKQKFAQLRRALSAVPNTHLDTESPREGYFQTLMSRGDRRVGQVHRAPSTRPTATGGASSATGSATASPACRIPTPTCTAPTATTNACRGTSSTTASTSPFSGSSAARRSWRGRRRRATRRRARRARPAEEMRVARGSWHVATGWPRGHIRPTSTSVS